MPKIAPRHARPDYFADWLEAETGRAHYFQHVDPGLYPPMIAKMKAGVLSITFETAIRLERAQKASNNPLKAELLMTFQEHRDLYRYVSGQAPAPDQLDVTRKTTERRARTAVFPSAKLS